MDAFKSRYVRACSDVAVDPIPEVMAALNVDEESLSASRRQGGQVLNLSTRSLSSKAILALARSLHNDTVFTSIDLSDTFLEDSGCIAICQALENNSMIKAVNIKGNNIRGEGTSALAHFIRQPTGVQNLNLEWNSVGLIESAFREFCEGLAINTSLAQLDLRNNRITPEGANMLANAVKRNTSLRRIDLRWNSVGTIGGLAIADALKYNSTITDIELSGNDVSQSCIKQIEESLERNREEQVTHERDVLETKVLHNKIESLESEHRSRMQDYEGLYRGQVSALEEKLGVSKSQVGTLEHVVREDQERIASLGAKLEFTTHQLNDAESRCAESERNRKAEISVLEQRIKDVESQLISREQELNDRMQTMLMEKKSLENELNTAGDRMQSESMRKNELEQYAQDSNRKVEHMTQETAMLKVQLEESKRELTEAEEKTRDQQEQLGLLLREQENHSQVWEERLLRSEAQKQEAVDEIRALRELNLRLRMESQEKLNDLENQMKTKAEEQAEKLRGEIRQLEGLVEEARNSANTFKRQQVLEKDGLEGRLRNETDGRLSAEREAQRLQIELSQCTTTLDNLTVRLEKAHDSENELRAKQEQQIRSELQLRSEHTSELRDIQISMMQKDEMISRLQEELRTQQALALKLREESERKLSDLEQHLMSIVKNSINDQRQSFVSQIPIPSYTGALGVQKTPVKSSPVPRAHEE